MTRCLRPVPLILGLLLTLSCLGALPAEAVNRAASTSTTITYEGYTLSWSKPDASDLKVVRAPGHPDRFPAGVSSATIRQAKSRVASATIRQAKSRVARSASQQASVDSCTGVPDSFGLANFQPACAKHDLCYGPDSSTDRLQCDRALLSDLTMACTRAYPTRTSRRLSCYSVAAIYYLGVRLLGEYFYQGTGNPS